jgi:hypothetical protein
MNDLGAPVGAYYPDDGSYTFNGFYDLESGGFASIAPCPGGNWGTVVSGINNQGIAIGGCFNSDQSVMSAFTVNNASVNLFVDPLSQASWGDGINDANQVVGYWQESDYNAMPFEHGFLAKNLGGSNYTEINYPFAPYATIPTAVNGAGHVVGFAMFPESDGFGFGYTYTSFIYENGTFTPINYQGDPDTKVFSINNNDQVLGQSDSCGTFLYDIATDSFVCFDPQIGDTCFVGGAWLSEVEGGLNDSGSVVGSEPGTSACIANNQP